jgi:putative thioredoxin
MKEALAASGRRSYLADMDPTTDPPGGSALPDPAREPGAPPAADLIFDVRSAEFEERVLKRSHEVPVLVDFWAPWCGPCRALTPVLTKEVQALGGKVLLAKVNTDEEKGLAQAFRISGIPAIKAFYRGRLAGEFSGARDARYVRSFIESMLPQPGESELEEAAQLITERRFDDAAQRLRGLLEREGALGAELRPTAQGLLAEAHIGLGNLDDAVAIIAAVDPRSTTSERAELLSKMIEFLRAGDAIPEEAATERLAKDESDAEARLALASHKARRRLFGEALELLIELVGGARAYRDRARQAMTLLFQYLGPQDELTHEYRRRLQVF